MTRQLSRDLAFKDIIGGTSASTELRETGIATVFPQAIGMAATWNTELVHEEANVISTEARAKYNDAISEGVHEIYHGLNILVTEHKYFPRPALGKRPGDLR